MNNTSKIKIFLVDDDALFLKDLEIEFLEHGDFSIETYATGELCVQHLINNPDIIILDYHLNGIERKAMNGIETLDEIKKFNHDTPVIMLSSQDKIDVAIDCMHHNAFDYVVKSETSFLRLKKAITTIFKLKKMENIVNWYMERS
jgi:DNA-binding NarL/FixJ family response regulator